MEDEGTTVVASYSRYGEGSAKAKDQQERVR